MRKTRSGSKKREREREPAIEAESEVVNAHEALNT